MALTRFSVSGLLFLVGDVPPARTPGRTQPDPTLDRAVVAATGTQRAQLAVPRFGRYSIRVASDQGIALPLVARMADRAPWTASSGTRDDRLDLFLERGE